MATVTEEMRGQDAKKLQETRFDLQYYKWIVYGIFKGCYVFFLGLNGIE